MTGADGRYSVAFPKQWWYPACRSSELGRKPLAITLMDTPIAVFRDGAGQPRALLDRCPHRNLALSRGRVHPDGTLECAYHGWRFDGCGSCTAVPGLLAGADASSRARDVTSYATREQDGFVWVWGEAGASPTKEPFALPDLAGFPTPSGTGEVVFPYDLECTMHAALENSLDVPHTAFLHQGIFRGGEQRDITAVREEVPGGLEVQYLGEPVGFGPIGRKEGRDLTFDHWDRFFMPCVAQIEYRVAGWVRITNTILHLPLSPFRTRAWFVVRFWTRVPAAITRPIVLARGKKILRQDAVVLAQQTDNIRRFGGERYTSTDLDLLGNGIWRMLRQAERAEQDEPAAPEPDDEPANRTVTFRA